MMRLTRQHPQPNHHRPARDDDHDRSAGPTRDPDWSPERHPARALAARRDRDDPERRTSPIGTPGQAETAGAGHGGDPAWKGAAAGSDTGRQDATEPAFRRGGPRAAARRDPESGFERPGQDPRHDDGSRDGSSEYKARQVRSGADRPLAPPPDAVAHLGRGDPVRVAARRPDAVQGEAPHADGLLGHSVLGAGWATGDLAALDHAIHAAACLRTGLSVALGPGAIMAAALADLGRYENLAYFAENTLCSITAATDLCPQALAAMGLGHAA